MQETHAKLNGHEPAAATPATVTLSSVTLLRLARLQGRAQGAAEVANAAIAAAQQLQAQLQQSLSEACEEAGLELPNEGSPLDLDWRTGVARVKPPEPAAPAR